MEFALLFKLFWLGLGAFDVIGIAAMPILLAQPNGIRRAWIFVSGSAVALMALGWAFAYGLGKPLVKFNNEYPWVQHAIELAAGCVLIGLGIWLYRRGRGGSSKALTPDSMAKRLLLPIPLLWLFGFLLVTIQSIIDVVFLVAMVETGTRQLPFLPLLLAVTTYTIAALLLQVLVIVVYMALPHAKRAAAMTKFNTLLESHGELVAGIISLVLGIALTMMSGWGLYQALALGQQ